MNETRQDVNKRGNKVSSRFLLNRERYHYDFNVCTPALGWKQYDTDCDAWYFGVWVHTVDRKILTYCEGDETVIKCLDDEHFRAELESMAEFYGDPPPAFTVIDNDGGVTKCYDERPKI